MGCSLSTQTYNKSDITPLRLNSSSVSRHSSFEAEGGGPLTILHFNDVYNIEEREKEPVGGAARFKTKMATRAHLDPLVLFSGDALNPSIMSTVTQGRQMIPVLNSLNVHAAVYGNHDFDFGVEHLASVARETNFPWLLSNVKEKVSGCFLANGVESLVIPWAGHKVGIMGLVEWEWLVTLATIEVEDVIYEDYVECARRLVVQLVDDGCDLLVALTHMRMPNDICLASSVPELHLVLGGHDHHYEKKLVGQTLILKSGSDFRQFSEITVTFDLFCRPHVDVVRHEVRSDVCPDPELEKVVSRYLAELQTGMEEELSFVGCDLEGRFAHIRTRESNLGNLVTDVMCKATQSDVALLNSGTFRSDSIHEAGVFRMKDLLAVLPMVDGLAVLEVTGEQMVTALENGVSQYPKHEGRFPQVSGMSFAFNPAQPSGHRVVEGSVRVGGAPLQPQQTYRLCTKGYIASGKDGYDIFKNAKVVLSQEDGPILSSIVRNYLSSCCKSRDEPDDSRPSYGRLDTGRTPINPTVEGRINICN